MSLLARGNRLREVRHRGIVFKDVVSGKITVTFVNVVEELGPHDRDGNRELAFRKDLLQLMVKAIREGFEALRALGLAASAELKQLIAEIRTVVYNLSVSTAAMDQLFKDGRPEFSERIRLGQLRGVGEFSQVATDRSRPLRSRRSPPAGCRSPQLPQRGVLENPTNPRGRKKRLT
jgi:hypothetical protein